MRSDLDSVTTGNCDFFPLPNTSQPCDLAHICNSTPYAAFANELRGTGIGETVHTVAKQRGMKRQQPLVVA